jgi:glycosyltransferase involved in cell wall biosynthesis
MTSPLSSVFLRGQLRHLMDDGYDVTVGVGTDDSVPAASFDDGVEVVQLPFRRDPHLARDALALFVTLRLIRRLRPAVVNASTPKAGLLGMVAAKASAVPVRTYVVRGLRFETAAGWRRRAYRTTEAIAMRCATHVIFNSASLLAVAEQEKLIHPGTGTVLASGSGNGVAVERFAHLPGRHRARAELGLPEDVPVVGFVGRLTRDKGVADLVRVFHDLVAQHPSLRLLLVGRFERGDPLDEATTRVITTDPRILHVDWKTSLAAAYEAMDVFVFPSYREGLPNAPLEAQLCSVPVVAYAATGTVDAVKDGVTGLLVPRGDQLALRDAVRELLLDGQRRDALGRAGRQWVATEFSPDRVWSHLSRLYRDALEASR